MSGLEDNVEVLMKYIRDELPDRERKEVGEKLLSNRQLRELYDTLKLVGSGGRAFKWMQIRNAALKMSSRIFRDFQKTIKKPDANYGVNVFDSKVLPLPEGVRPAAVDSRRLKYVMGPYNLELHLKPVSIDSYDVVGEISGFKGDSPIKVTMRSGKLTLTAVADEFNLFFFSRVPVRNYVFSFMSGKRKIGSIDIEI